MSENFIDAFMWLCIGLAVGAGAMWAKDFDLFIYEKAALICRDHNLSRCCGDQLPQGAIIVRVKQLNKEAGLYEIYWRF